MKDELVDIVDENDNIIATGMRKEMRGKNLRHRSTFILVFNSKNGILVTKRAKSKETFPGLYEIGQGGVVRHGESYEENAMREVKEEVGVKGVKLEFLFDFHYEDEKTKYIARTFRCTYNGKIKLQKEEIEDGFFVSLDKLKQMLKEHPEDFTPDSIDFMKRYFDFVGRA